jgi:hypothetical protein
LKYGAGNANPPILLGDAMKKLTANEQAEVLKEMREDEAAATREDGHWYGREGPAGSGEGLAMLQRDDPAIDELLADLRKVASGRYEKGPLWNLGDTMVWGASDKGVILERLDPNDQIEVLQSEIRWNHYKEQGLSSTQAGVIFSNVREGESPDNWLDGIFDEVRLENHKVAGFKALVEHSRNSPANYYFEDIDDTRRTWVNLSPAGKLQYIAGDAALYDVPFKAFAAVAKDVIGDDIDAALETVFEYKKELRSIGRLFPDDGRTEPTPLIDQVKDVLDYASALENQEKERLEGKARILEGISDVLDGKQSDRWAEGAKAFRDILRGEQPKSQEGTKQERGGRDM